MCIIMSKSFYETINILLFVQYESEHVMVQLFTVCTELMLSVHRADCERATQPYFSGGWGYDFFQAQDQPIVTTHVRVGNRVFSHSLDVVSKMYTHLSNVLADHHNVLAYIKAWLLPLNKIKLQLLYYTMT